MAMLSHFLLFFLTHGWILGTIYSSLCYFMVFRHSLQTSLVDHAWRTGVPPVCYSYILPLLSSPCHCAGEQVSPLSAYLYITLSIVLIFSTHLRIYNTMTLSVVIVILPFDRFDCCFNPVLHTTALTALTLFVCCTAFGVSWGALVCGVLSFRWHVMNHITSWLWKAVMTVVGVACLYLFVKLHMKPPQVIGGANYLSSLSRCSPYIIHPLVSLFFPVFFFFFSSPSLSSFSL